MSSNSEPTATQIADLKQAIANLAKSKRVSPDTLSASEFNSAELQQSSVSNPLLSHSISFGSTSGHLRAASSVSCWGFS
jgi:hypothetical protein